AGGVRRVEDSRKVLASTIKIDAGSVNRDPDEVHRAWWVDVFYQHLRVKLRVESIYVWGKRPIRVHRDHGPVRVVEGDAFQSQRLGDRHLLRIHSRTDLNGRTHRHADHRRRDGGEVHVAFTRLTPANLVSQRLQR